MKRSLLGLLSAAHFLVDLSCAFLLFLSLPQSGRAEALLLYNFCAFALQMPLGLLADRFRQNGSFGALGCLVVALAFPLRSCSSLLPLLLGLGNALFHVGGGLVVLNAAKGPGALGLFVSPGALGIFLGSLLGKAGSFPLWPIPLSLLLISPFLYGGRNENSPFDLPKGGGALFGLSALFLVVLLRSLLGMQLNFPWKEDFSLLLCLCLVLGKSAGGFLAQGIGLRKASLFPLLLSSLCFSLSPSPLFGLMGVFLFNMSMPLSLHAGARILKGARGFSFGLLTFALFLGFLPSYFSLSIPAKPLFYGALALLSLPLLLYGVKKSC